MCMECTFVKDTNEITEKINGFVLKDIQKRKKKEFKTIAWQVIIVTIFDRPMQKNKQQMLIIFDSITLIKLFDENVTNTPEKLTKWKNKYILFEQLFNFNSRKNAELSNTIF